jgi:hypothetical protein
MPRPTSDLRAVKGLRNLRQARNFLGLSWRALAVLIPKRSGHGHISHPTLIAWSNGDRPMADGYFSRICQLVANRLTQRYGREIALRASRNSPWKLTPVIWCSSCQRWHELKRWNQRTH